MLGVRKGVRVGLFLPNCTYYVVCFFAVLKAGGTVVNYNPLYAEREIARQIEDSGTSIMVTLNIKGLYPKVAPRLQDTCLETIVVGSMGGLLPWRQRTLFALLRHNEIADVAHDLHHVKFKMLIANDGRLAPVGIRSARGRRGAAIHRRHHRAAEGRDADPRRAACQHRAGAPLGGRQQAGPGEGDRRAAAVPRVRHDRGDERQPRRRLRDHSAAALPAGRDSEGDPRAARHRDAGRADDVLGDQRLGPARALRSLEPALLHLRRRATAAAGTGDLRAADGLRAGRGLRPDRSRSGVHDQSLRRRSQGQVGRPAPARDDHRDCRDRRARSAPATRSARRDLHPRTPGHGWLWRPFRRDGAGAARRPALHRRCGLSRPGRLSLSDRPDQGPDPVRRLQRLSAHGRGGHRAAPRGRGGRGLRPARRRIAARSSRRSSRCARARR